MSRAVERMIDDTHLDGRLHIVKTQNCDGVIAAMKEVFDVHTYKKYNTQTATKLVGSVPNIVALNWAQEWGVRLYSKEWLEKARHRLKHDPDWRSLRAGH